MGDCDPENEKLTAQCKRLVRGLSSLQDGRLTDWEPVAACVNAAMLFLALDVTEGGTRPVLSDRSKAAAWWRDWAKHEASDALLKVLKEALAAAPLVMQASTKDETELRQVVTAAVTDITLLVSDVLRDHAMQKWPRLQDEFIIREHGFTRIVHAMLAVLPVSSTMPIPYLALDAALDLAKTFDRISAGLASGTTKAMGNSNAEMHSRFLTESSSLLHHYHSSCHIEVLVTEWCRNLERQLADEGPAVETNWWSVLPILLAVPLLLVTPLVLPHLLGHAMTAHKAIEECFGEQCPMGQGI